MDSSCSLASGIGRPNCLHMFHVKHEWGGVAAGAEGRDLQGNASLLMKRMRHQAPIKTQISVWEQTLLSRLHGMSQQW